MPLLIDIRKFTVINELVEQSAVTVSERLTTVSGVSSDINVTGLSFIDSRDLEQEMGARTQYVAVIDLQSPPYGQMVLTFSEEAATQVVERMTGTPVEGEFTDLHESGLRELCNILASGFIDGWANTFDITIEIGTPTVERTTGEDIADKIRSRSLPDSLSFIVDTTVEIENDAEPLSFKFYMVPDIGSFVRLVDQFASVESEV